MKFFTNVHVFFLYINTKDLSLLSRFFMQLTYLICFCLMHGKSIQYNIYHTFPVKGAGMGNWVRGVPLI